MKNILSKFKFPPMMVVVLVSILSFGIYHHKPMGSGPAGPKVPSEPFKSVWSDKKVLLLGMGDSIMTAFGAGGQRFGCFQRVFRTPSDDISEMRGKDLSTVYPNLKVLNIASNASSSGIHLMDVRSMPEQPFDVFGIVMISTGGIDLIHNYGKSPPVDQALYGASYVDSKRYGDLFRARLGGILDTLSSKFPGGVEVFINNIYDPTDGVGDIENAHPFLKLVQKLPPWPDGLKYLTLWNRIIKEESGKRDYVHLVDIHSVMLGHGLHCDDESNGYYHQDDPTYWYYLNLEDPNKRGYDAVRRVYLLKMIEVLYKGSANLGQRN